MPSHSEPTAMNCNVRHPLIRIAHPTRRTRRAVERGLTLLESLVVLAILGVLLGSALPHFGKATERRHLEGTAAQLATDIQFTRSLAVAHNGGMRMSFRALPTGTCYVVHNGAANACQCDPSGQASCSGGAVAQRIVGFGSNAPVQLNANVGSVLFHPVHGTSTPTGTLRVVSRSGAAIHQVVNIMGRTRSCTPNSVPGYPAC
jgi:type IV fimbrial biogenesis protein FimT